MCFALTNGMTQVELKQRHIKLWPMPAGGKGARTLLLLKTHSESRYQSVQSCITLTETGETTATTTSSSVQTGRTTICFMRDSAH
jgi:hypothetical protein